MKYNDKHPLVSVILPVYNTEKHIRKCICSILEQTYENVEIIVVNDGSIDGSEDICIEKAKIDSRINYIYQDNRGVSEARNRGILHASGEYVLFVDSDDWLHPLAIEKLVEAIIQYNSDLCICGYIIAEKKGLTEKEISQETIDGKHKIVEYFSDHFLEHIASAVWGKLYKKALITNKFNSEITMGEDLLFNLQYCQNIDRICSIPYPLYYYNQENENSIVHNFKPSYYYQNKIVCGQWLEWCQKYNGVELDSIYYHIVRLFFEAIIFTCKTWEIRKKDELARMMDEDISYSIQQSKHMFSRVQRRLLSLMLHRHYFLASLTCAIYARLKVIKYKQKVISNE